MIDNKAESLEEWYQILQETFDKYTLLINNLLVPILETTESESETDTETNQEKYNRELQLYKKKCDMYIEAQRPSKYYLELRTNTV